MFTCHAMHSGTLGISPLTEYSFLTFKGGVSTQDGTCMGYQPGISPRPKCDVTISQPHWHTKETYNSHRLTAILLCISHTIHTMHTSEQLATLH